MNHEYLRRTLSVTAPALTRRHALMLGAAGLGVAALSGGPAQAVLRVDVNEGNVQPIPIALPDFQAGSPADVEVARGISQIITGNLKRSGLFAPIDHAAFIEKITNTDAAPRFPDWRAINAQALVTGRIARQADGRVKAGADAGGRCETSQTPHHVHHCKAGREVQVNAAWSGYSSV
jgi:TolB amino-terminal domain